MTVADLRRIYRPAQFLLQVLLLYCFLALDNVVWSAAEINGGFGYSKQVYGENKQNNRVSRSYSGSVAVYLFRATGIEFNYSYADDILTENDRILLEPDLYITSIQNRVNTKVYGTGLRQAFAGNSSFIVPVLSLGYARQFKNSTTDYTLEDQGEQIIISNNSAGTHNNAMFGTFMLKINLTRLFSITGSVKSVFATNAFNEAKDNLRYDAGFSWML